MSDLRILHIVYSQTSKAITYYNSKLILPLFMKNKKLKQIKERRRRTSMTRSRVKNFCLGGQVVILIYLSRQRFTRIYTSFCFFFIIIIYTHFCFIIIIMCTHTHTFLFNELYTCTHAKKKNLFLLKIMFDGDIL